MPASLNMLLSLPLSVYAYPKVRPKVRSGLRAIMIQAVPPAVFWFVKLAWLGRQLIFWYSLRTQSGRLGISSTSAKALETEWS